MASTLWHGPQRGATASAVAPCVAVAVLIYWPSSTLCGGVAVAVLIYWPSSTLCGGGCAHLLAQ